MEFFQLLLVLVLGGAGFYFGKNFGGSERLESEGVLLEKKKELLSEAEKESVEVLAEAKKKAKEQMERANENIVLLEKQLKRDEQNISNKEKALEQKVSFNKDSQKEIESIKNEVKISKSEISGIAEKMVDALLKKSGKSKDEIKSEIARDIDNSLIYEEEILVKKTEEAMREDLEKNAKHVVIEAIQKYSRESSVEKRYSVISVPKDNVKGKIMGVDAENVLYFEEKTEASVVFNDAPNTIIVSHYNLLRQEIAFIAMKKLIKTKEVNPGVIDKALEDSKKEMDAVLLKIGAEAAKKLELEGYPDEFLRLIGRLKFRTSFGQNILSHSFEVAAFGKMLAAEIGSDIREAELACFFHDIGKSIDHDENRPHDILSKEILEKYGFHENIVHAAHAHHDAVPQVRPVDYIVMAADAISAGRPGARQETLEKYLEKIRALESIAYDAEGVEKAYAISAGREVRVFVKSDKVDDGKARGVAKEIAHNVEENVIYPGKIKINVIRRTEAYSYANSEKKKKSNKK